METLKKISNNEFEIEKEGKMNVPARIFANRLLLESIEKDKTFQQIKNVATLPGIIKYSFAMPDAHQGYGFSIGGVAAFDLKKGVISPGGVGYDINCGVRLLATDISVEDFMKKREQVLKDFDKTIPSGLGEGNEKKISQEELNEILTKGAKFAIEKKLGKKEDLERCEEKGCMENANPKDVSQRAKSRGLGQAGTLGAGNHFLEIQKIEEIIDEKTSSAFGLKKGKVAIMIHCGSRGLGHQVASDYIGLMEKEYGTKKLADRELVNAPIESELGKKYLSAMNCAINFAFYNRQKIMHHVREVLEKHFPKNKNHLVYDVCHNIAKIEEHVIDGKKQSVCVHRKGATRSFGPGRKEIPEVYRKVGQPVLIPGSMGTASYVLVGTKKAEEISFGSTAHGAGRIMSRVGANKSLTPKEIKKFLSDKDIKIEYHDDRGLVAEAPQAYKDVEEVVKVSDEVGLAKKVARLVPIGVLKG
jgi:tRNA-splicing ligase RtcB